MGRRLSSYRDPRNASSRSLDERAQGTDMPMDPRGLVPNPLPRTGLDCLVLSPNEGDVETPPRNAPARVQERVRMNEAEKHGCHSFLLESERIRQRENTEGKKK